MGLMTKKMNRDNFIRNGSIFLVLILVVATISFIYTANRIQRLEKNINLIHKNLDETNARVRFTTSYLEVIDNNLRYYIGTNSTRYLIHGDR